MATSVFRSTTKRTPLRNPLLPIDCFLLVFLILHVSISSVLWGIAAIGVAALAPRQIAAVLSIPAEQKLGGFGRKWDHGGTPLRWFSLLVIYHESPVLSSKKASARIEWFFKLGFVGRLRWGFGSEMVVGCLTSHPRGMCFQIWIYRAVWNFVRRGAFYMRPKMIAPFQRADMESAPTVKYFVIPCWV